LAERLAREIMDAYPTVRGITVQIRKPQVHLEGVMDSVGELKLVGPGAGSSSINKGE
jgi:hypothetical protein